MLVRYGLKVMDVAATENLLRVLIQYRVQHASVSFLLPREIPIELSGDPGR
jgi:hypothetical protein